MRYLVVLVLLGGCYYPHHSSHRMEMKVESLVDSVYSCINRIKVDWEIYGDTLTFDFQEKHLVFMPVRDRDIPDGIVDYMNKRTLLENERLVIRKDMNGVLYSIRMVYEEGFIVYISALGQSQPHYVMCMYVRCNCL